MVLHFASVGLGVSETHQSRFHALSGPILSPFTRRDCLLSVIHIPATCSHMRPRLMSRNQLLRPPNANYALHKFSMHMTCPQLSTSFDDRSRQIRQVSLLMPNYCGKATATAGDSGELAVRGSNIYMWFSPAFGSSVDSFSFAAKVHLWMPAPLAISSGEALRRRHERPASASRRWCYLLKFRSGMLRTP